MRFARLLVCCMLVFVCTFAFTDFKVGQEAPKFKPARWLQGSPLKERLSGRMTVVLFFSSWNEASISTFPSLGKIAQEYKDVADFVAVSTLEEREEDTQNKVIPLLKRLEDDIKFSVASDGKSNALANSWVKAAGMNDLPALFVVDKKGKVAWYGYPQGTLRTVLKQLKNGEWDYEEAKSFCAECVKEMSRPSISESTRDSKSFRRTFDEAISKQDFAKALQLLDKQLAAYPDEEGRYQESKLWLLIQLKSPALTKYFEKITSSKDAEDPEHLNSLLWSVVEGDLMLSRNFYLSCERVANKLKKMSGKNYLYLDTVALTYWRVGKKSDALKLQIEAVRLAEADSNAVKNILAEMKERLALFSKAGNL